MIIVKKTPETTSQKVISTFIKRVKKFNLSARVRKTSNFLPKPSKLQRHRKAIRKAHYLAAVTNGAKLAKKI